MNQRVHSFGCAQQEWSRRKSTEAANASIYMPKTLTSIFPNGCGKLYPTLASNLGRELPDNNPCPSRPCSQNECQLQDQPTLGSKLPTWGDFVEVPSLSPLRIIRIGNRCHPRKAAACELGPWLSSRHSKPGGALGWWQCLWAWLSILFICVIIMWNLYLRCSTWARFKWQSGRSMLVLVRRPGYSSQHLQNCCLATPSSL